MVNFYAHKVHWRDVKDNVKTQSIFVYRNPNMSMVGIVYCAEFITFIPLSGRQAMNVIT